MMSLVFGTYLLISFLVSDPDSGFDALAYFLYVVIFGSDMLICGGILYVMDNYVPPTPPSA